MPSIIKHNYLRRHNVWRNCWERRVTFCGKNQVNLGSFFLCFSNLTSLIYIMNLQFYLFMWSEWKIKRKKVKQGVPPQASLLVHYLSYHFCYKRLICKWSNIFLYYSFVACTQSDLFSISEAGTIAGSSCGKMSTGAGKRTSQKALSIDGLNSPKVEGMHSHE